MDPGYMLEGMVDPTWGLPDSPGWGLRPGAVLGGNNPYMGGTPPATSVEPELDANTRALIDFDMEQNRQTMGLDPAPYGANPVLQSLSTYSPALASATPSWGGFGRGMGRSPSSPQLGSYEQSTDYPGISAATVLGNVEANRRGEMVDPTWSGPFAPFAGGSFLRGLTGADAIDFANAVTGARQATPNTETAVQAAMHQAGISQEEMQAALAATGHVMSPGQYAQQYFDKTDTMANRALSNITSGLRSTLGTRTANEQVIDKVKSALNDFRTLTPARLSPYMHSKLSPEVLHALSPEGIEEARISAQDLAVATFGENQAGQNTYGQASTGWAPGQALTTTDVLGNVVDVTLSNDPVSVAIANARKSALANPDITVANTIAEQIAETTATVNAMGLTGAAAAAAAAQINANQGYVTADEYAGFKEAQQAQDAAQAAAAAAQEADDAAAAAVETFSDVDWGQPAAPTASIAEDRAVQNAIIDALVSAVGPEESALSAGYMADLGYGGGFAAGGTGAEGLNGNGEGYGGFGSGWT
jgi:hypothetical protein